MFFSLMSVLPRLDQWIAFHTALVHHLYRGLHAHNWEITSVQDPNLIENTRLVPTVSLAVRGIPIDMFVVKLTTSDIDDGNKRDFDSFPCWRNPWKDPADLTLVSPFRKALYVVCVNDKISSSTMRSVPTVRETGDNFISGGLENIKWF